MNRSMRPRRNVGDRGGRELRDMIVVFGAGGFIGTYLTDKLVRAGCKVIASDISEIGEVYYHRQGIRYQRVDITQKGEFERLPTEGIGAVVHLACVQPANVSEEKYDPADYVRVNVLGTLNILEFCRVNKVPKIIYTCSHRNTQGMWAEKSGRPILESDGRSIKFTGDYAMFSISESVATDCVEHYAQAYGIEGIVLRLPPVYGYGPHTEIFKDGKPLKTGFQVFIENAEQGRPLELWGDPESGRDIVYVKDVVSAIGLALKKPGIGGLYNISSGRRLSLKEQAECIIRVFSPPGRRSEIRYQPDKPNLIESYVYDVGKARRTFGWQPKYSFKDMLIDYRKEMDSGRFAFLVEKRRMLMQGAQRV
jgi:UDP-glucose 4-epimerase